MRTWFAVAVVTSVVSIASVSFAQAQDGSGIPVAEEGVQPYPTELVDRPIILPHGAEALLTLWTPDNDAVDLFDYINARASGRFGTGRFEAFGGLEFRVKEPDGADSEALATIWGGAAFELGPDQVLRGTVYLAEPTNDFYKILIVDGDFEIKRKLTPKVALVAAGGLNFINPLPEEPLPEALWILSGFAQGEGQIQLTPTVAASGFVRAVVPVAHSPEELDTENVFNVGAQGTMVVAPNFDLVGGFTVNDAFDEDDRITWFFVGGAVRM